MNKLIATLLLSYCVLTLSAQKKEKFPFTFKGTFTEVEVTGNLKVELIPSTKTEVKVTVELEVPEEEPFEPDTSIKDTTQIRILKQQWEATRFKPKNEVVSVKFRGDTLKIAETPPKPDKKHPRVWIQVFYKDGSITDLRSQEGGFLYSNYLIKGDSLIFSVRTNGKMEAQVSAKYVHLESGENGWMNVIGNSQRLMVQGRTNGEIILNEYNTKEMEVILSTNASAQVPVPNYLRARVSTGAVLRHFGQLREADVKEIMGGKIIQL